jgi:hypothetical protein
MSSVAAALSPMGDPATAGISRQGNPQAYARMKSGHSQGAITERYIHAAAVMFPGAADKTEARLFGRPRRQW